MKKVFVSVPLSDRTEWEIAQMVEETEENYLMSFGLEMYDYMRRNTEFVCHAYTRSIPDEVYERAVKSKIPNLVYLGEALAKMGDCDEVIFAKEWEQARGCRVERLAYELYFKNES